MVRVFLRSEFVCIFYCLLETRLAVEYNGFVLIDWRIAASPVSKDFLSIVRAADDLDFSGGRGGGIEFRERESIPLPISAPNRGGCGRHPRFPRNILTRNLISGSPGPNEIIHDCSYSEDAPGVFRTRNKYVYTTHPPLDTGMMTYREIIFDLSSLVSSDIALRVMASEA